MNGQRFALKNGERRRLFSRRLREAAEETNVGAECFEQAGVLPRGESVLARDVFDNQREVGEQAMGYLGKEVVGAVHADLCSASNKNHLCSVPIA
jgi:hypothetical protein